MKRVKHWRVVLLGTGISVLTIVLIISQIEWELLRDSLAAARFGYVIPAALLLVLGLFARGQRWRVLLSDGLPYWRAFHIMNVAYLINNLLPFRVGEVARAFLATRARPPVPVPKSASTIIVERLLDVLAVVLMLAYGLAFAPVPPALQQTGLLMGVVSLAGFLFLVALSRQRETAHRLLAVFTARLRFLPANRLGRWLDQFLDGLLPLAGVRPLLLAFLWTGISWALSGYAGYLLMFVFFSDPTLPATFIYIAAAAFAIAVPAVPGNLGTYELSIILALRGLGYADSETLAAFAVMVHLVNLLVNASLGVVGFIEEGVTVEELSQGVRDVTESGMMESSAQPAIKPTNEVSKQV